jgi:hypothetical protein
MRLAAVVFLSLALAGCGGALDDGRAQFAKGRYPEAKQTFASLDYDSLRWDDARRAEYALYRGLTEAALGDRAHASVWLREAKAIEDARPGSLSPQDAHRLKIGLETNDLE